MLVLPSPEPIVYDDRSLWENICLPDRSHLALALVHGLPDSGQDVGSFLAREKMETRNGQLLIGICETQMMSRIIAEIPLL